MTTSLLQDLTWAWRVARANRALTLVVTLTLAIGIGATVAVFSIVDAWLLRPLNFPEPERLVIGLGAARERPTEPAVFLPYRSYAAWKDRCRSFERVAGAFRRSYLIAGSGEAATMPGLVVTPDFFQTLGVAAALGRTLSAGDAHGPRATVLSHGLWEQQFGASPAVIGTHVTLNGLPHQVIGVMPRDFEFRMLDQDRGFALWTLIDNGEPLYGPNGIGPIATVARLRSGATLEAAQAEVASIHREVEAQFVENMTQYLPLLTSLQADNTRTIRATLVTVGGAVICLLLITCMNVGSVQLGRGLGRAREAAIRVALGAGRRRLIQQSLTEAILLSVIGGALGLPMASAATRLFARWNPLGMLPPHDLGIDLRVFAFSLIAMIGAAILCGFLPAMRVGSADPMDALRSGNRLTGSPAQRSQVALLAAQVGMSVMLLVATTLLMRTFVRLQREPLGFEASNLTVVGITLPRGEFDTSERRNAFYRLLAERLRAVPGVERVAAGTMPPLSSGPPVSIRRSTDEARQAVRVSAQEVTPEFFDTLGIRLHAGRTFDVTDSATSPQVVVLNENAAGLMFGSAPGAIGRELQVGSEPRQVIGVVGNTRSVFFNTLEWLTKPVVYLPAAQAFGVPRDPTVRSFGFHLHIRSVRPVSLSEIKAAARAVSSGAAVGEAGSAAEAISRATRQPAFRMALLGWFGAVSLLLAAIGVYGLVSQVVAHRMREIGVRMALGAAGRDVVRVVAGRAVLTAIVGAVCGSAAALALGRSMQTLLYGVRATDALSFVTAAGALLAVSVAAALIPSWRATKINPTDVLRAE